jgi:hypothetical protein
VFTADGVNEENIGKAWGRLFEHSHQLLLFQQTSAISTPHPDVTQIFKLWQVYLENVNPLLKVTHAPSLQGRIIEAISNMSNINPTFDALLFSIYCIAVFSLSERRCQELFSESKEVLLVKYRAGCQTALAKCHFLKTKELDALTALFLYLVGLSY